MDRPLRGLRRGDLGRELLAGVTLLAVSVPLNIGYAQIAGLPPTAGLYALVIPTLVYVLLVSSRQVVASPDAAAAALVFSSLLSIGAAPADLAEMAAAQAILCGAVLVGAALLRLGFLADFLSHPILVGFVAGLALEVMLSQVRKMTGIERGDAEGFFAELVELTLSLGSASALACVMSVLALTALLLARRLAPALPAALIVLVVATAATSALRLDEAGIDVLGTVPGGPPQLAVPTLSLEQWAALIPSAVALALITMAEGVLLSRSYGERRGYRVRPDRDLLAFGAANVAAGFSASFAVGSSASRTAAMDQAGSRTQLPSLVLVVGSLLLLLFGTALLADVPSPVIGAVVAVAVIKLLGIAELREIARLSRYELGIALSCLIGVLVLGPLLGLLVAFMLSLVNLVRRAARPEIDIIEPLSGDPARGTTLARGAGDVVVVRFAGPLFFASSGMLGERVMALLDGRAPTAIVLDAEGIGDLDVTGSLALERLLEQLERAGVRVAVTRLRPRLRARLERFGLLHRLQEFGTNREAVAELARARGTRRGASA